MHCGFNCLMEVFHLKLILHILSIWLPYGMTHSPYFMDTIIPQSQALKFLANGVTNVLFIIVILAWKEDIDLPT